MRIGSSKMIWGLAGGILFGGVAACWHDLYVDDDGVATVAVGPPAPHIEVVPAAPYPGAVWHGGHWVWRGGRHVWIAGRYLSPRPGYVYRPHSWVHRRHHWRYTPGRWHRRR